MISTSIQVFTQDQHPFQSTPNDGKISVPSHAERVYLGTCMERPAVPQGEGKEENHPPADELSSEFGTETTTWDESLPLALRQQGR